MIKRFEGTVEDLIANMPVLPVLRDTYCSQKMTDEIIDFYLKMEDVPGVSGPRRNLGKALYMDNYTSLTQTSYYEVYEEFLGDIAEEVSKYIEVPSRLIALNDLSFEYRRRVRTAMGHCEPIYNGIPLCNKSNECRDLPILPIKKIDLDYIKSTTQTNADKIIRTFENSYKSDLFALSESLRNCWNQDYIARKIILILKNIALKENINISEVKIINSELCRRIAHACKLDN